MISVVILFLAFSLKKKSEFKFYSKYRTVCWKIVGKLRLKDSTGFKDDSVSKRNARSRDGTAFKGRNVLTRNARFKGRIVPKIAKRF